jgi:hypothetical protein
MSGEVLVYRDPSGREAEVLSDDGDRVVIFVRPYEIQGEQGPETVPGGEWTGTEEEFRCGWRAVAP